MEKFAGGGGASGEVNSSGGGGDEVQIFMVLLRLPTVGTDLLISLNSPANLVSYST